MLRTILTSTKLRHEACQPRSADQSAISQIVSNLRCHHLGAHVSISAPNTFSRKVSQNSTEQKAITANTGKTSRGFLQGDHQECGKRSDGLKPRRPECRDAMLLFRGEWAWHGRRFVVRQQGRSCSPGYWFAVLLVIILIINSIFISFLLLEPPPCYRVQSDTLRQIWTIGLFFIQKRYHFVDFSRFCGTIYWFLTVWGRVWNELYVT